MKRVVGASVIVAFLGAVVGGTCVGFMALMAPAEIRPIVGKAGASESPPDVPPPEQIAPKAATETLEFGHGHSHAAQAKEPEPKKAKRPVAKKVIHVARHRGPERRQYKDEQSPQIFGSFGGFGDNYWR